MLLILSYLISSHLILSYLILSYLILSYQAEYARTLELQYLAEVPSSAAGALPIGLATSHGRDRLASAAEAWGLVVRARPGWAEAAHRLSLVEQARALAI